MTTPPVGSPAVTRIRSLRTLAATLMSALVVIGLALFFALSDDSSVDGYPDTWVPVVLGVLAVASYALSETIGYRAVALAPGTSAENAMTTSLASFQSLMIMRFALSEAVAIVALALTFVVVPSSVMVYVIGGVLALALMVVHVWPSERVISKVERSLERQGARSYLRDGLYGNAPGSGGAITRL